MIACVSDECRRPRQDRQIDEWRGGEKERHKDRERDRGTDEGRQTYSLYKDIVDMMALICDSNIQDAKGRMIYKKKSIEHKMWQLIMEYM